MRITLPLIAAMLGGCIVAEPATRTTPPPGPVTTDHRTDEAPAPSEAGPLSCGGNESIVLSDCAIEGDVAVDAHGNCSVTLTNCTISGTTAIDAHGNASVVISGGSIYGQVAIDAHGNASVTVQGAAVEGNIDKHGNASVTVY